MNNKRWFILMALSMLAMLVLSACNSAANEPTSDTAGEEHLD